MENKMNKKGAISSALMDFAGYAAFIIILLVFLLLFNIAKPDKIQGGKLQQIGFTGIDSNAILLNYLRSNLSYSGEDITMSDYVSIAVQKISSPYDTSSFPEIKSRLERYFNQSGECYSLTITNSGKIVLDISERAESSPILCRPTDAQIINIPNRNGEILKVELSTGK